MMQTPDSIVSIDFGTSRTKVGYFDFVTKRRELFRLGDDDSPFIPSVFFLSDNGSRYYGDEAQLLGKENSEGFLDQPLKRSLRESIIIAGNGQKATPNFLLQLLLSGLKQKITQHPAFVENFPNQIVFTIPVQYGPADEALIRKSAINAGFDESKVSFIYEPVAAAQAWFIETHQQAEHIIILDCGGGTLDWACLRQLSQGSFEIIADLPPGGDNRIGGWDIDEELFKFVLTNATNGEIKYCRENKNSIMKKLQVLKEKYSKTNSGGTIKLGNITFQIPVEDIERIVIVRYVNQLMSSILPYIEKVNQYFNCDNSTILLVGGSSRFPILMKSLLESGKCNPILWERSEYATVLGAIDYIIPKTEKIVNNDEYLLIEKGEKALQNKEYLIAYYYYFLLSNYHPSNKKYHLITDELDSTKFNTFDGLKIQLHRAIQSGFDSDKCNLIYGMILVSSDNKSINIKESEDIFLILLKHDTENALGYFGLALVNLKLGEINYALDFLNKALSKNTDLLIAKYLKSYIHFLIGENDIAVNLVDEMLLLEPEYVDAIVLKAVILVATFQQYHKGFKLFYKAMEIDKDSIDSGDALLALGFCYKEINHDSSFPKKAFDCFQKSARLGLSTAMSELADCYLSGFGTEVEINKAFCLHRVAAENGDLYSMKFIGECYLNGYVVSENSKRAFSWYLKAAELEDIEAMEFVSACYQNGIGVSRSINNANLWKNKLTQFNNIKLNNNGG